MTGFQRVRNLFAIAWLIMGLGAIALLDRGWQNYIPVPDSAIEAMERFYGLDGREMQ